MENLKSKYPGFTPALAIAVGSIVPKCVGAASPKMAIVPKWIGAKKGCEINGEYWSSQEAHDIL